MLSVRPESTGKSLFHSRMRLSSSRSENESRSIRTGLGSNHLKNVLRHRTRVPKCF